MEIRRESNRKKPWKSKDDRNYSKLLLKMENFNQD